jgi:hypothetical protein
MSLDAMLAQSLRRWREDCAPIDLKRYAKREWGAETCFLLPSRGSSSPYSAHIAAVALIRIVGSLLSITWIRSTKENGLPARRASVNQSVQSPKIPHSSIQGEDVRQELADSLIVGLGSEGHRITAETTSTVIPRKSEIDEHH